MLSLGMLASRARSIAARSRMLPLGSPPPCLAAMMISRPSLLNSFPRCWSTLPFLILMLCHFECPDTLNPLGGGPAPSPRAYAHTIARRPRRAQGAGAADIRANPPLLGLHRHRRG